MSLLDGNDFMYTSPFEPRTVDKSLPCYLVGALIFAACRVWGLPSLRSCVCAWVEGVMRSLGEGRSVRVRETDKKKKKRGGKDQD